MDEALVILRPYNEGKDIAFIFATWRSSSYYGGLKTRGPSRAFFKQKTLEVKEALKKAEVRIACLSDDHEFIIGYSVFTGSHLDWIYVRADYRSKGIGTLLLPKTILTYTDDLTKIGDAIRLKKNLTLKEK